MQTNNFSIAFAAILMASTLTALAQKDSSGIYSTAGDFKKGKLAYAINYKTEKHKINDYLFLNASQVKVKHNGQSYKLDKNNVYGYRNTKGEDFRFVGNETYKILNRDEPILIYQHVQSVSNPKTTPTVVNHYYFTTDAASTPIELTKENLKRAFPDNHKFHDALDNTFRNDNELTNYDKFHKTYKLNWVYKNNIS